ncbi:MAG: hypothetical protein JNM18_08130 [Planctomycetaceae bacterium]|nr:hypothetical protein [Planctomycetaceae bacterium]
MTPSWPTVDEDCTSTTLSDLAWNLTMVLLVIALTASSERIATLSVTMPRLNGSATKSTHATAPCRVVIDARGEVRVDDRSLGAIQDASVQAALSRCVEQRVRAQPQTPVQIVTDERTTAQALLMTAEVARRHSSQIDFLAQQSTASRE